MYSNRENPYSGDRFYIIIHWHCFSLQFMLPYGVWWCCLFIYWYPISLLAVEVPLQTWISCKYTAAIMRGGWASGAAILIQEVKKPILPLEPSHFTPAAVCHDRYQYGWCCTLTYQNGPICHKQQQEISASSTDHFVYLLILLFQVREPLTPWAKVSCLLLACGLLLGTLTFLKELHTCVIFAPLRLLLLLSNMLLFSRGNLRKVCTSWISFKNLIQYFCSCLLVKFFTQILDDTLSRMKKVDLQWRTSSHRPYIPHFSRATTALVFTSPEETLPAGLHHTTPQMNF